LRADRAWTLLRMANVQAGSGREGLPGKWFQEPGFRDYLTGEPLGADDARAMIGDYYDEQGWDAETGVPSAEALERLGLSG
ncbi:MAG: aldehyde ferredoxin oxidoreductase C-terminal domain-containing protein, partial [Desulfobacterota bacterium]|nr:aldehyde ferredoxin oxidoreductase C-terminal domain-containing protein [Thermodesulfobacteriota bacterium]